MNLQVAEVAPITHANTLGWRSKLFYRWILSKPRLIGVSAPVVLPRKRSTLSDRKFRCGSSALLATRRPHGYLLSTGPNAAHGHL